jgi:hypothetical protein
VDTRSNGEGITGRKYRCEQDHVFITRVEESVERVADRRGLFKGSLRSTYHLLSAEYRRTKASKKLPISSFSLPRSS